MLNSTNQMLKMIREACRNVRKCCTIPTTLLRTVRHWSLLLSSQLHLYEKGGMPAVFLQLLAGRLAHFASSPSHNGKCEEMENDLTAALFPNRSGKPLLLLDFPHTSRPHNPVV